MKLLACVSPLLDWCYNNLLRYELIETFNSVNALNKLVNNLQLAFDIELRNCMQICVNNGFAQDTVDSVKMVIIAWVDDRVLNEDCKLASCWNKLPLQEIYYQKRELGAGFYASLGKSLNYPKQNIDLLSLFYGLLLLGFVGKYKLLDDPVQCQVMIDNEVKYLEAELKTYVKTAVPEFKLLALDDLDNHVAKPNVKQIKSIRKWLLTTMLICTILLLAC